ncbi:hypothetical protein [Mesorhizobium sp. CN2-181]|uniref:hypothetical protein n=1 Tax=Mesorhizobium yinganensis TaxID=3157707 RepID=UPI0032B82531
MMVRLNTCLSGNAYCLLPGDEHEFPDDEAARLITAGFAVPVTDRKMETTTKKRVSEKRG